MAGKALAVVMLVACAWQASYAFSHLQNDLAFAQVEAELSFWGAEQYQPTDATRSATANTLTQLTAREPNNPNYHTLSALQHSWEAWWALGAQPREAHNRAAVEAVATAQGLRPAFARGWSIMLEYAKRAGNEQAQATAEHRLQALRPMPAQAL